MRLRWLVVLVLMVAGCSFQPKPNLLPRQYTSYLAAVNERPVFQRFVLVSRTSDHGNDAASGAFALDTVTGQLCRTYPFDDPKAPILPLCRDLWLNKGTPIGVADDGAKK